MWRVNRHLSLADLLEGHPLGLAMVVSPHQSLSRVLRLGLPVSVFGQAGICTGATVLSSLMFEVFFCQFAFWLLLICSI